MKAMTVDVKTSNGRILCCTVFRSGGKKLLAKGHVISDEGVQERRGIRAVETQPSKSAPVEPGGSRSGGAILRCHEAVVQAY